MRTPSPAPAVRTRDHLVGRRLEVRTDESLYAVLGWSESNLGSRTTGESLECEIRRSHPGDRLLCRTSATALQNPLGPDDLQPFTQNTTTSQLPVVDPSTGREVNSGIAPYDPEHRMSENHSALARTRTMAAPPLPRSTATVLTILDSSERHELNPSFPGTPSQEVTCIAPTWLGSHSCHTELQDE